MSTLSVTTLQGLASSPTPTKVEVASGHHLYAPGHVLQVVNATHATAVSTTSTSFVTTGLTASITPKSTSSKVLISFSTAVYKSSGNAHGITTIFRGTVSGTDLGASNSWGFGAHYEPANSDDSTGTNTATFLDSPSTTSSQTYTIGIRSNTGTAVYAQGNASKGTITLMEIAQ